MKTNILKNLKCYLCILGSTCLLSGQIFSGNFSIYDLWGGLNVYAEEAQANLSIDGIHSKGYCMIDASNGRVLAGKDYETMYPMASTTKIMTCILALECGNLDDIVKISPYAASMPDVQLNARVDEEYKLEDLLYSLMLESHNDVAVAVAEHIGGSVTEFAAMMNEKAKDLGCTDTYYITPNGLDGEEVDEKGEKKIHSTTAYDLAKIMSYCIKNQDFIRITTTKSHTFSTVSGNRSHTVNNKNTLLTTMDGVISGKTGYTGDAGYCYICAIKRDDRIFSIALLGAGWPPHKNYKWQDVKKLLNYGEKNFFNKTVYEQENYVAKLQVKNGVEGDVWVYTDKSVSLNMREGETVDLRYNIEEKLTAPVEKGQIAGQVEIYVNDKLYTTVPVKTINGVKQRDLRYWAERVLGEFLP